MTTSPDLDSGDLDRGDLDRGHRDRVREAFAEWAAGTGGPFALLAADATWTILGTGPVARTYGSRAEFVELVLDPFNARMATPLVPTVRHLFVDGDWVVVLFDGRATRRDGQPYDNVYTWYLRFADRGADAMIVEVLVLFDTIEFADLWDRVSPG